MICCYTKDSSVKENFDISAKLECCGTEQCQIVCWQITEMGGYLQRWDTYQIPQNLRPSPAPRWPCNNFFWKHMQDICD
jgi:hypothetical protein